MRQKFVVNGLQVGRVDLMGDSRMGDLDVPKSEVRRVLGTPNVQDDPDKVGKSWGFSINGRRCGIWYYKGSTIASTFGPSDLIHRLFER